MEEFFLSKINRLWMTWAAVALALLVICFEFLFDLQAFPVLYKIALSADWILILSFVAYMGIDAFLSRNMILLWFARQKVSLVILFVVVSLLQVPRLAAGIVIASIVVGLMFRLLDTSFGRTLIIRINLKPSQTMALSFLGVIAIGTLLLTFPAATQNARGARLVDALFTMTSATCVTGLSVVDVGSYFTRFGQAVILAGIQIGGLGMMVLSAIFAVFVGGMIPSRRRSGLGELLDIGTSQGLKSLIKAIAAVTLVTEFIGAFILFFLWNDRDYGFVERVWMSIFHSVSAFCNAGIGLLSDSFVKYVDNYPVCAVIIALVILGGLGFAVIADLADSRVWAIKHPIAIWGRLRLQSKVVLTATLLLNIFGMLLFLFYEYDGALRGLSIGSKINASLFQAVTLRTAGFNSVLQNTLAPPTIIFCIVWMFIGACPGSTGGGIKTTTAAVAIMAVRASIRGRGEVELMGRRISPVTVNRSLSIVLISFVIVTVFFMLIGGRQGFPMERVIFEIVSAFGTVGLSMGITADLDTLSRLLISALMFIGRVGPLTLALAVAEIKRKSEFALPLGNLPVG